MTVRTFEALLRETFPSFLAKVFQTLHPNEPPLEMSWYLLAICHRVTESLAGNEPRLQITVPPRHLKSIALAVALPAWLLGRDPTTKIMVASYSQDLARQHAEHCRTIMETAWYKQLFQTARIHPRGNRQLELVTTSGGGRKAVSVDGSITGFGGNIIIVDDCMKAEDVHSQVERDRIKRWYDNTLTTRLNDKSTGIIISIQQRLHEDDLPAYLVEKGYGQLNLPAIAEQDERIAVGHGRWHDRQIGDLLSPKREPRDVLDRLRRELGPQAFSAQYQQQPITMEGNLIKLEWFGIYEGEPDRSHYTKIVQSWDTATVDAPTADWSVCTTWGYFGGDWDLIDVFRQKLDFPDLRRAMLRLKHFWRPDKVLVEDASSGRGVFQALRAEGHKEVQLWKPHGDKEQRVIDNTAELETGRFCLPEHAMWLDALRSELRAFPMGKHDDQVDSVSQFLTFVRLNWKWELEERLPNGRIKAIVRQKHRRAA
jgi:predicted phage terminase large subunit-like protein